MTITLRRLGHPSLTFEGKELVRLSSRSTYKGEKEGAKERQDKQWLELGLYHRPGDTKAPYVAQISYRSVVPSEIDVDRVAGCATLEGLGEKLRAYDPTENILWAPDSLRKRLENAIRIKWHDLIGRCLDEALKHGR